MNLKKVAIDENLLYWGNENELILVKILVLKKEFLQKIQHYLYL